MDRQDSRIEDILAKALWEVAEIVSGGGVQGFKEVEARVRGMEWRLGPMVAERIGMVGDEEIEWALGRNKECVEGLARNPRWSAESRKRWQDDAVSLLSGRVETWSPAKISEAEKLLEALGVEGVEGELWQAFEGERGTRAAQVRLLARGAGSKEQWRLVEGCMESPELLAVAVGQWPEIEAPLLERMFQVAKPTPGLVYWVLLRAFEAGVETREYLKGVPAEIAREILLDICRSISAGKAVGTHRVVGGALFVWLLAKDPRLLEVGGMFSEEKGETALAMEALTGEFGSKEWAHVLARAQGEMRNWLLAALGKQRRAGSARALTIT